MSLIILLSGPSPLAMFGGLSKSPLFIIRIKIDATAKVIMMKTSPKVRRTQLLIR